MAISRYWRLTGFCTPNSGPLELSEARIYGAGVPVDAGATLSSTVPPDAGALADLRDTLTTGVVTWAYTRYSQPGFALMWDFGAGGGVESASLRLGSGGSAGTFPFDLTIQSSVDGRYWETTATVISVTYPGPSALTAVPSDSGSKPHRYWSIKCLPPVIGGAYAIGEVILRSTVGGGSVAAGGVAIGTKSSYVAGSGPDMAFDGNGTTYFDPGANYVGAYVGYDFGTPVSIAEYGLWASYPGYIPTAFEFRWSDDGVTWTVVDTRSGVSWEGSAPQYFQITGGTVVVIPTDVPPANRLRAVARLPALYTGEEQPPAVHGHLRPCTFADAYNGGLGIVSGTVKEKGTPANTPLRSRVVLIDERSRITIRETWSDALTGNYEFKGVKQGVPYTVLSYDHMHNYRAVAADNLLAEDMP